MKIRNILSVISIFCIFIFIYLFVGFSSKIIEKDTTLFFSIEKLKQPIEIYKLTENSRLYSKYDNIYFYDGEGKNKLESAFDKNLITVDYIITQMKFENAFNDGGTRVLKYSDTNNKFSNIEFYLIECNAIDQNKNIIITDSDYYEDVNNYCFD